ncbi:MAG: calcium-binding protein [Hyphomicrobiales bacterium]|nr:calcium-binding protein [Hyphomicrobiales bacterium]
MAINVTGPGWRTVINGTTRNDVLFGTDDMEQIAGHGGSDFIYGSGGADLIIGDDEGAANFIDTVSYEYSPEAVQINLNTASQHGGDAEGDVLVSIEAIVGSRFNDSITGDKGDNVLTGGAGLDVINGGGGNDTLFGGFDRANDILDGGSGSDWVDYSAASGSMTIQLHEQKGFTYVDGYAALDPGLSSFQFGGKTYTTLTPAVQEDTLRNIENIIGTQYNDTITGNYQNNIIDGGAGADAINGKGGIDTVTYASDRSGADLFIDLLQSVQHGGHAEGDTLVSIENIIAGNGDDAIFGSNGNNRLEGGAGADIILGRDGNDTIVSGSGADILDGGQGMDTFVFNFTGDSGATVVTGFEAQLRGVSSYNINLGIDTIRNFETGIDTIDLSGIDADITSAGNNQFDFVDGFTGDAGQLVYANGILMGDVNGDKVADLTIFVNGLSAGDLIF